VLKIMPVYGTRPEAIKMAPIIKELERNPLFHCITVVTGQHRSMLDQVNELFDIVPMHDLNIIQPRQSLTSIMTKTMSGLDDLLTSNRPDAVIVQGDTTTSTAAAMTAFYHGIPVVHVEAGLRSGNLFSPFPEEANRRLTSQISSLHLAPTETSRMNLLRENINPDDIVVTGNTVIDALLEVVGKNLPFSDPKLEALVASTSRILLVTTHRRENLGESMAGIGRAIVRIASDNPDVTIVLPIHMNPAVREALVPELENVQNVIITEPLSYGQFTRVLSMCAAVLTDSGGVQEEAPSLGKPVLVMRANTERPEAVLAGTVRLVGTDEDRIVAEVNKLLNDSDHYSAMAQSVNPYGDGSAAARTVAAIGHMLGQGQRNPDFVAGLAFGHSTSSSRR
jgi:UDP-N-acetylglucosamine 2-epimerase (non-hydrolysing)